VFALALVAFAHRDLICGATLEAFALFIKPAVRKSPMLALALIVLAEGLLPPIARARAVPVGLTLLCGAAGWKGLRLAEALVILANRILPLQIALVSPGPRVGAVRSRVAAGPGVLLADAPVVLAKGLEKVPEAAVRPLALALFGRGAGGHALALAAALVGVLHAGRCFVHGAVLPVGPVGLALFILAAEGD